MVARGRVPAVAPGSRGGTVSPFLIPQLVLDQAQLRIVSQISGGTLPPLFVAPAPVAAEVQSQPCCSLQQDRDTKRKTKIGRRLRMGLVRHSRARLMDKLRRVSCRTKCESGSRYVIIQEDDMWSIWGDGNDTGVMGW